jgi:cysteine desulfurase
MTRNIKSSITNGMKSVYLDYAATTPVDPRVAEVMQPYLSQEFGNPGSLHQFGQRASAAVFKARQTIAASIFADYSEIVFTGSATEANNLVFGGVMRRFVRDRIKQKAKHVMPRFIISAIEHESILETAKDLQRDGADVVIIPVLKDGIIDLKKLKAALNAQTALVSVMYANNEIGTVQPIAEISKIIREFRGNNQWPLLHTDAVQAFQYLDCNVNLLGVDMLTLSAHKIYGPKGIGALYVKNHGLGSRKPVKDHDKYLLDAIITGGGQEMKLRSGTENVPYIVGFAKAVELASKERVTQARQVARLRDYALACLRRIYKNLKVNGSMKNRLPNNLNVYVPDMLAEKMIVSLDLQGIAISSGSACVARSLDPSHVLLALGFNKERAKNSLRITLGRPSSKQDVDALVAALKKVKN